MPNMKRLISSLCFLWLMDQLRETNFFCGGNERGKNFWKFVFTNVHRNFQHWLRRKKWKGMCDLGAEWGVTLLLLDINCVLLLVLYISHFPPSFTRHRNPGVNFCFHQLSCNHLGTQLLDTFSKSFLKSRILVLLLMAIIPNLNTSQFWPMGLKMTVLGDSYWKLLKIRLGCLFSCFPLISCWNMAVDTFCRSYVKATSMSV